jgi:poly [ADP-ribose] polymerase
MGVLKKLDSVPSKYVRVIKLINVSSENNNKVYNMYELGDGHWVAEYGRVGNNMSIELHPMDDWDSTYKKKTSGKRGVSGTYTDVTSIHAVSDSSSGNDIVDIKNSAVKKFVSELQSYSNTSVKNNYIVSADTVTEKQVEEAQNVIDNLTTKININQKTDDINEQLITLYKIIPRKMKKVQDYLLNFSKLTNSSIDDFKRLISNEQATLDVMRGQVAQVSFNSNAKKNKIDILASMGLSIEEITNQEENMIKKLLGSNSHQYRKAFKITNLRTQSKFDNHLKIASNKNCQLFWHGSRNENWWSILDTGLILRPANAVITGKMFGYGIYYAPKAQKSIGYTSLRGSYWASGSANKAYLALFNVHTGNHFHVLGKSSKHRHHESWMYNLTHSGLKKYGNYDSLFAEGGADLRNDEWIVYKEEQSTIGYLVEIS